MTTQIEYPAIGADGSGTATRGQRYTTTEYEALAHFVCKKISLVNRNCARDRGFFLVLIPGLLLNLTDMAYAT